MCKGPQRGEPLCPSMMRAAETHLGNNLFVETQQREQFEEEVDCAHMWLDDRKVARHDEIGGEVLSLVGRMKRLVQIGKT